MRKGSGHGWCQATPSPLAIRGSYLRSCTRSGAAFLDRAALDRARQRRRGTCHTNSSDLRARPAAPGGSPTVQALYPDRAGAG